MRRRRSSGSCSSLSLSLSLFPVLFYCKEASFLLIKTAANGLQGGIGWCPYVGVDMHGSCSRDRLGIISEGLKCPKSADTMSCVLIVLMGQRDNDKSCFTARMNNGTSGACQLKNIVGIEEYVWVAKQVARCFKHLKISVEQAQ